jgi:hypothetical protein
VGSPDGRYLFFLRWREGAGGVFWVEADFLRPGNADGPGTPAQIDVVLRDGLHMWKGPTAAMVVRPS